MLAGHVAAGAVLFEDRFAMGGVAGERRGFLERGQNFGAVRIAAGEERFRLLRQRRVTVFEQSGAGAHFDAGRFDLIALDGCQQFRNPFFAANQRAHRARPRFGAQRFPDSQNHGRRFRVAGFANGHDGLRLHFGGRIAGENFR